MFEDIREDIRAAAVWDDHEQISRLFGPKAARLATVLTSATLQTVLVYRLQAFASERGIPLVPGVCQRLTMLLSGTYIGVHTRIGPRLLLAHGMVVIDGRETEIGTRAQIMPFVTIGLNTGGPDPDFRGPKIGANVFIGTGAKVLGAVTIGDHARIGANAVVMQDVPANCTAVGVPARILEHEEPFGRAKPPSA